MSGIQILIFEKSVIIQHGLSAIIDKIPVVHEIHVVNSSEDFLAFIKTTIPDLILSNTDSIEKIQLKQIQDIVVKNKIKTILIQTEKSSGLSLVPNENIIQLTYNEEQIREIIRTKIDIPKQENKSKDKETISSREESIVREIAMGLSNKEIADKLFISQHTVITHRKNITRKLGIKSVSGLTIYAILNKLISMGEVE